jgi:phage baseplate assembly protein W
MEFWVDNAPQPLKLGLTGVEEIAQNIRLILSTPKGSVPLDRNFGINWDLIDKPYPATIQLLKAEIVKAIENYEPMVKVKEVKLGKASADGQLNVRVLVEILNEV